MLEDRLVISDGCDAVLEASGSFVILGELNLLEVRNLDGWDQV